MPGLSSPTNFYFFAGMLMAAILALEFCMPSVPKLGNCVLPAWEKSPVREWQCFDGGDTRIFIRIV